MNYNFDCIVKNSLEKHPETSLTVFKKKEEGWEKMIDPFYCPEQKSIPRINTYDKSVTFSLTLNHPIGEDKNCKVTKIENGSVNGPNKVSNFKWEVEVIAEEGGTASTAVEIEVTGSE